MFRGHALEKKLENFVQNLFFSLGLTIPKDDPEYINIFCFINNLLSLI